jgi:hypothetical protein
LYVQCRQIIKAADAFNSGLNWWFSCMPVGNPNVELRSSCKN